jgi:hypothetical protein
VVALLAIQFPIGSFMLDVQVPAGESRTPVQALHHYFTDFRRAQSGF